MQLKQLKKEVEQLPSASASVANLRKHWVSAIRYNESTQTSLLDPLGPETRQLVREKVALASKLLEELEYGQRIAQKLQHYARCLVELKLTELNGDKAKSTLLTKRLLQDEYLNLQATIADIRSFDATLQEFLRHYRDVNEVLQKELPLEDNVAFTHAPHGVSLRTLQMISFRQKEAVRGLGTEFVKMVKKRKSG